MSVTIVDMSVWRIFLERVTEKMSGLRDQLTLDLDSTFKSLQDIIQSTSELFINLPEPLAGIISPEVASR